MADVWRLMGGVKVPGLGFSFATWFMAVLIANICIGLFSLSLGIIHRSGTNYRSGHGGKKHISDERKNDEK